MAYLVLSSKFTKMGQGTVGEFHFLHSVTTLCLPSCFIKPRVSAFEQTVIFFPQSTRSRSSYQSRKRITRVQSDGRTKKAGMSACDVTHSRAFPLAAQRMHSSFRQRSGFGAPRPDTAARQGEEAASAYIRSSVLPPAPPALRTSGPPLAYRYRRVVCVPTQRGSCFKCTFLFSSPPALSPRGILIWLCARACA